MEKPEHPYRISQIVQADCSFGYPGPIGIGGDQFDLLVVFVFNFAHDLL